MRKPLVILENVTIRDGKALRFPNTYWCINTNEQWAVIGPTGSGKSLFVNALCRRASIVQGKIVYFFDDDVHGRAYLQRGEIVIVSGETQRELLQQYAGYHQARWQSFEGQEAPTVATLLTGQHIEHTSPYDVTPLKILENVYTARRTQVVDVLGISCLLERKIIHLSHGETRKVLLARALMQSPKLLILNDPFLGLDRASRKTLVQVLGAIIEQGQTHLLLVTSRKEEIPEGITHVVGLAGHQVVMQGVKRRILHSPFSRQVFEAKVQPMAQNTGRFPVEDWETSPPGTPLIELHNVNISYSGVQVLHNLTWTLRQGEHWAIRGPNGAGKSTLLSLIVADNPQAYANDLKLFGRSRGSGESIWDIKRHIGWVAPELHLFYHSRGSCQAVVCSGFFDSIDVYQDVTSAQTQRALSWMQALNIEKLAKHSFLSVSVNEQRVVLLARALVKHPLLLILDEPCHGLDAPHRIQLLHLLDSLCRQTPVSLLYVAHHTDELPEAITHVLQLERGTIQTCGLRQRDMSI